MDEMNYEAMRKALGLAVSILEDLPANLRPASNMKDMRDLIAGKSTGRDGLIVMEAVSTALAFRTFNAVTHPIDTKDPDAMATRINSQMHEFGTLFELAAKFDPLTIGVYYREACSRLAALAKSAK
jgi:hypothetical protein